MKVYINPKYEGLSEFINSIPMIFPRKGQLIYDERNTLKVFHVNGININIKAFKRPHLINRFAYRYLRKSKAERSFSNALEIQNRGIWTPDPIAYIETYKNGLINKSYYISIHEEVNGTMKEIYKHNEKDCKDLIQAFTIFTARLHEKGILHKDYSPGNVLFKYINNDYEFYLVDLNRIKFKNIEILDSCKSFSRLRANNDTLNMISEEYSKIRKYDEKICQKLIHLYNRRFWKKQLIRHPECKYEFQQI